MNNCFKRCCLVLHSIYVIHSTHSKKKFETNFCPTHTVIGYQLLYFIFAVRWGVYLWWWMGEMKHLIRRQLIKFPFFLLRIVWKAGNDIWFLFQKKKRILIASQTHRRTWRYPSIFSIQMIWWWYLPWKILISFRSMDCMSSNELLSFLDLVQFFMYIVHSVHSTMSTVHRIHCGRMLND